TQVGFNVERSLTTYNNDDRASSRGVLFGRYIFLYGSSLYLPPFHYVEAFASHQDNFMPVPRTTVPGAERFPEQTALGVHYHLNYLTPYWDPEAGLAVDVTCQGGLPVCGGQSDFYQAFGQVATVKGMPDWLCGLRDVPGLGWVPDTRLAARLYGAAGLPDRGQFFSLGGGQLFRGFSPA